MEKKKRRITIDDLPHNAAADLSEEDMRMVRGGPNRRQHDHIGNFNFKVEIEGITVTAFDRPNG